MRLAYADPPYPGCAHLYPEKTEVDHEELVAKLCDYDGWALSTNENALQYVLGLCPPGVRVLAWCKNNAPPFMAHPFPAWEPVICVPARKLDKDKTRSYLVHPAPAGFIDRSAPFIGSKPDGFCEWVLRCLGATASDSLDDLFPGTGAMSKAWARYRAQPSLLSPAVITTPRKAERIMRSDPETFPTLAKDSLEFGGMSKRPFCEVKSCRNRSVGFWEDAYGVSWLVCEEHARERRATA